MNFLVKAKTNGNTVHCVLYSVYYAKVAYLKHKHYIIHKRYDWLLFFAQFRNFGAIHKILIGLIVLIKKIS